MIFNLFIIIFFFFFLNGIKAITFHRFFKFLNQQINIKYIEYILIIYCLLEQT